MADQVRDYDADPIDRTADDGPNARKEKDMIYIYQNDDETFEDEYGRPVEIKAKPKPPLELGSMTGYNEDGGVIWNAEFLYRKEGLPGKWYSTNAKIAAFALHYSAEDAIAFSLEYIGLDATYYIGARSLDGQSYNTVYLNSLKTGRQSHLAYERLVDANG